MSAPLWARGAPTLPSEIRRDGFAPSPGANRHWAVRSFRAPSSGAPCTCSPPSRVRPTAREAHRLPGPGGASRALVLLRRKLDTNYIAVTDSPDQGQLFPEEPS